MTTKDKWDALTEAGRRRYLDKAAEMLSGDLYACTRVWSAWHVGTMREGDFIKADEDEEIVFDTAFAIFEAVCDETGEES